MFWITKCDKNFKNWITTCDGITKRDGLQTVTVQRIPEFRYLDTNFCSINYVNRSQNENS